MNEFLVNILNAINSVVQNYGWSIVVFTILIKLIITPLDVKSRKSMRRMTKLQPEIAKLQKKYANDKEKLNLKTSELYRKEKINPLAGCLPMLISMPILFAMFGAMRYIANQQIAQQAIDLITNGIQTNESWLWVKNLWMPDSPFYAMVPDLNSLKMIPADVWSSVFSKLSPEVVSQLAGLGEGLAITAENISGDSIFAVLSQVPAYIEEMKLWETMPSLNLLITQLSIYAHNNGWFILPILAAGTQFLMTLLQPVQATAPAADGQAAGAGTGNFMKYFFPLFTLWLCFSYNAGFSIYWVVSNLFATVQSLILNAYFEKQDEKAALVAGEGNIK